MNRQQTLKQYLSNFEKHYISKIINQTGSNILRAARVLGISRRHLYRKIDQYTIPIERGKI